MKKICINCIHCEKKNVLVCNHPKLAGAAGCFNVRMIRLIGNGMQNEMMEDSFNELCGRNGDWYEPKNA